MDYQLLPHRVYVQLTQRCNLRCSMCGWKVWSSHDKIMNGAVFVRVVGECVANGIRGIRFSSAQGEPLLHPDWFPYAMRALEAGLEVNINTNITPIADKNLDCLAALASLWPNHFSIQCSFAGYDKASYEKVYAGARFEDVSAKLAKLWKRLGRLSIVQIRGIVYDRAEADRTHDYLNSLGIPREYVTLEQPDNFAGIVDSVRPKSKQTMCYILRDHIGIYVNGDVTACGSRDSEGAMKLGNIMERGLKQLRSNSIYQGFIGAHMSGDLGGMALCKRCDLPRC